MKIRPAIEFLKEVHEELSKNSPDDWVTFDEAMSDPQGEAILKAMEKYADQFKKPKRRVK